MTGTLIANVGYTETKIAASEIGGSERENRGHHRRENRGQTTERIQRE